MLISCMVKQPKACATFNFIFAVAFKTFVYGGGAGGEVKCKLVLFFFSHTCPVPRYLSESVFA